MALWGGAPPARRARREQETVDERHKLSKVSGRLAERAYTVHGTK